MLHFLNKSVKQTKSKASIWKLTMHSFVYFCEYGIQTCSLCQSISFYVYSFIMSIQTNPFSPTGEDLP